jgi:hypothetical protein
MFHTDQGAPLPRNDGTGRWAAAGSPRSLAGRGRALAPVWIERLWRTVQDEEVSWKDDETPREARPGFATFLVRDKEWRQPQALGEQTPASGYFGSSG